MAIFSPFGDEPDPPQVVPPKGGPRVQTPPPLSPFGDEATAPEQQVNQAYDILRSIGTGLRGAVEGIPGMPQDLATLAGRGAGWATGTEQNWDIPYAPSTDEVNQFTSQLVGPSYQPQTTAGKYARTAAEFVPVAPFGGAGRAVKAIGTGIGAGLASEAAGQATEGSKYEGLARLMTGLLSGTAASGVEKGVRHAMDRPNRLAEQAAEDAASQHGVRLTKGQRTGDVARQTTEQEMLHGGRGELAQRLMQQRLQENTGNIREAGTRFMDQAAPARGADPVTSGGLLNQQTRGRAEDLMQRGGQSIQDAINEGVIVDAQRLRGLPSELEGKLTGIDPYIPDVVIDTNTPMAAKAKSQIDTFVKKFDDPSKIDESLASVERLRQTIGKMQAVTPEDKRAMGKLMDAFDDWYDDVVTNDAAVAKTPPGTPSGKAPEQVLEDLKSGRATFKEGADISRPRGKPPGGKEVAKIASEGTLPEETARLFKPNDRGDLSPAAIKAMERLHSTGAGSADLDQVRGIVLDVLMDGDPGKVATRIENFTRNNPTAAQRLFTSDQLRTMQDWAETNRRLVPNPAATNPSKSGFGVMRAMGREAQKGAAGKGGILGALMGGPVGAAVGGTAGVAANAVGNWMEGRAARKALAPADRSTLTETIVKGGAKGASDVRKGATQGALSVTISDPDDPNYGDRVKVISEGKDGYKVRLPNGKEKIIGKALVKEK